MLEPRAKVPKVAKDARGAMRPRMRVAAPGAQADETCRKCGKICLIASACHSSRQARQPKEDRVAQKNAREAKVQEKTCWNCGEPWHVGALCPKKKGHAVAKQTPASQDGQDATVGAIGRHFDYGIVEQASASERF